MKSTKRIPKKVVLPSFITLFLLKREFVVFNFHQIKWSLTNIYDYIIYPRIRSIKKNDAEIQFLIKFTDLAVTWQKSILLNEITIVLVLKYLHHHQQLPAILLSFIVKILDSFLNFLPNLPVKKKKNYFIRLFSWDCKSISMLFFN